MTLLCGGRQSTTFLTINRDNHHTFHTNMMPMRAASDSQHSRRRKLGARPGFQRPRRTIHTVTYRGGPSLRGRRPLGITPLKSQRYPLRRHETLQQEQQQPREEPQPQEDHQDLVSTPSSQAATPAQPATTPTIHTYRKCDHCKNLRPEHNSIWRHCQNPDCQARMCQHCIKMPDSPNPFHCTMTCTRTVQER
jgi:hypothetical protein